MEHIPLENLKSLADVRQVPLSRQQKLEIWASALQAHGGRISTLDSIEYLPVWRRANVRKDNSALSVAFAEPRLRAAGLEGDSYSEIRSFFSLSHEDMHRLTCRCRLGRSEPASNTASRLRGMAGRKTLWERAQALFAR